MSEEPTEAIPHVSPLDAAAAKGDLSWPSDPDVDPEGSPEPIREPRANVPGTLTGFDGRG